MMTDLINFGTSSANDDHSLNEEEVPLLKNIPNNGLALISPQSVGEQEDDLKLPKPGGIKVTPAGSTAEKYVLFNPLSNTKSLHLHFEQPLIYRRLCI